MHEHTVELQRSHPAICPVTRRALLCQIKDVVIKPLNVCSCDTTFIFPSTLSTPLFLRADQPCLDVYHLDSFTVHQGYLESFRLPRAVAKDPPERKTM